MGNIFTAAEMKDALVCKATTLQTVWIENKGKGTFEIHPLPAMAQWSPVYSIHTGDYNGDGNIDIVLNTNEFSMTASLGRHDALNGLLLAGDGKGGFRPLSILESGIFIPGNGKALVQLSVGGMSALAASQNKGLLKFFRNKTAPGKPLQATADETAAMVKLKKVVHSGWNFLTAHPSSPSQPEPCGYTMPWKV